MARYLGDTWTLTFNTYDTNGNLADATALTVTITAPDTTTPVTGAATTHAGTGTYTITHTPTMGGMYLAVGTATGAVASVAPIDFYVEPITAGYQPGIVTLAEAKAFLGLATSASDTILRSHVQVASRMCEDFTNLVWRTRTVTELHDGGYQTLMLRKRPVQSVTTVTILGSAYTGWVLDPLAGLVYKTLTGASGWVYAPGQTSVTYVAGPSGNIIPQPIRQGVLDLVRHLFNRQRGGSNQPRQAGVASVIDQRYSMVIPRDVEQSWEQYRDGGI